MKKNASKTKPLVVSIHGDDFKIDATFQNSKVGKIMAEAVQSISRFAESRGQVPVAAPMPPINELVAEFAKTLEPTQIEVIVGGMSPAQKIMFFQILTMAIPEHVSPPVTNVAPEPQVNAQA